MIVGVDHVALSTDDLEAGIKRLEVSGFRLHFAERGVLNPAGKSRFMLQPGGRHDLAYCAGPRGLAIELTRHERAMEEGSSAYEPVWEGKVAAGSVIGARLGGPDGTSGRVPVRLPDFRTACWREGDDGPPAIVSLILPVPACEVSARFWCEGLGANLERQVEGAMEVEIRSPFPSRRGRLRLESRPQVKARHLDEAGFNCLALLSTEIDRDLEAVRAVARETSPVFSLQVGGKSVQLAFARGPGGELVELVSPGRRA